MKQLHINILISLLLIIVVLIVANQSLPSVDASTGQNPSLVVIEANTGHLRLHGIGFRPGSLVNLELRRLHGNQAVTGVDLWVDARGAFDAEMATDMLSEQVANTSGTSSIQWNEWVVVARATTGTFQVPVRQ